MGVSILGLRAHRFLLILSTVAIGIAGSKVADDLASLPWWLALAASCVLLGLSEYARDMYVKAEELAAATGREVETTASDILQRRRAILFFLTLAAVIVLATVAGVLEADVL
jgi:hypothetical protein